MRKKSKEGIILIYVLIFTIAITTLLLVLHYRVEKHIDEFAEKTEFIKMENISETGYAIGKKLLEIDKNSYDWYGDVWGKEIEMNVGNYKIDMKITDEDGKINLNKVIGEKGKVNTLLLGLLKNLFAFMGYSDSMVDCLLDWIDEDEIPRNSGAESTYYRMNNYPYIPPNKPLYSIKEIILIKDFSKEIVYGKNSQEEEGEEEKEIRKGLINFISIISDDKININTCEGEMLSAMGYNQANVDIIMEERTRRPLNERFLLHINRNITLKNKRIIKYKSSHFSINISVENIENGKKVNFKFFVRRDKENNVELLKKEKIWEN